MRSPLSASRIRPSAILVAALAAAALAAWPAAASVRNTTVAGDHARTTVRTQTPPATPATAVPAPRTAAGTWTPIGPYSLPGRMNGVAPRVLNVPIIDAGSDGGGWFQGYALGDAGWTPMATRLGFGIDQEVVKLVFPGDGSYWERTTVLGTNDELAFSDDDGATWSDVTLVLNDGRVPAPGRWRLLGADRWSNVEYLLARVYDPNADDSLYVFAVSFDSGASFEEWRVISHHLVDLWVSQNGDGQMVLAEGDPYDNVAIEIGNEDGYVWSFTPEAVPTWQQYGYPGLMVTAQSEAGVVNRIWVDHGDDLYRTTDGGTTWDGVRPSFTPGGPRGLRASVHSIDEIMWTDSEGSPFFGKLYVSQDGGVTEHFFNLGDGWGDPDHPAFHCTNIDVVNWPWALAANGARLAERRADGTIVKHAIALRSRARDGGPVTQDFTERFYVASGGGIFVRVPGDTTVARLTSNLSNQQINDVASQRNTTLYNSYAASRDNGLLYTYATSPTTCDAWMAVLSSMGDDVSDVATIYGPNFADITYWMQLPYGLMLIAGGGPFTGLWGAGLDWNVVHRFVAADPVDPYVAYSGADAIERMTYDHVTHTCSSAAVTAAIGTGHGGIVGFAISPANHDRWMVAMRDGTYFLSLNAGATWIPASGLAPGVMDEVWLNRVKIVCSPYDPNEAWCLGTFPSHTTDGGLTWSPADSGLPLGNETVFDVGYDSDAAHTVYLAAASGPYQWYGASWVSLDDGSIPKVQFRSVETIPYRGVVRFATWGAGLLDFATGATAGVSPAPIVTSLALAPDANPIRGMGRIDYALPAPGRATIELIDVSGRRVATLLDAVQSAGRGSVALDASRIGPGVYFARLTTPQGVRAARCVVLR